MATECLAATGNSFHALEASLVFDRADRGGGRAFYPFDQQLSASSTGRWIGQTALVPVAGN